MEKKCLIRYNGRHDYTKELENLGFIVKKKQYLDNLRITLIRTYYSGKEYDTAAKSVMSLDDKIKIEELKEFRSCSGYL